MMALKMLLVRVELTAIYFVLGVTEETLLEWLGRAAAKAQAINQHLLREVCVTHVQLDEMWNLIARKCRHRASANGENLPESEDGRQWVWLNYAPEFRLAAVVGSRTYATALGVDPNASNGRFWSTVFLQRWLELFPARLDCGLSPR